MSKELTVAPLPTIRRFPTYLGVLEELKVKGNEFASATDIANALKLKPIQVRKDLGYTGVVGKPKVGFEIAVLQKGIRTFLGWEKVSEAFMVGAGALGSALLGFGGFKEYGLNIVAAFDNSEELAGNTIHGKRIFPMTKLPDLVSRMGIQIAILTVPAEVAQEVTDVLVASGVKGIWNFSTPYIKVPEGVIVQNENLASGLAILSVRLANE
jgi:redox-sensing transcriptional repressor